MANNDIIVSEMTPASQINTGDLMIMTQPDAQSETGYSTKSGTVLQVSNKMLKGTNYETDLPSFTNKNVLGGMEELKGDIFNLLPVDEASGSIANFETELAAPLQSLLVDVVATQPSGTPTPSTPLPITGYPSANITRCGVNLWDEDWELGTYNDLGEKVAWDGAIRSKNKISVKAGETYYFNYSGRFRLNFYLDNVFVESRYIGTVDNRIITIPNNVNQIAFGTWNDYGTTYNNDISINYPSTDTAYHAYNGSNVTIAFGQTVYGGVLDVTRGKMHVTHEYITIPLSNILAATSESNLWRVSANQAFYDANNRYKMGICNMLTFKTAYVDVNNNNNTVAFNNDSGLQLVFRNDSITTEADAISFVTTLEFVYPLATPFDIDLTPEVISAIVGENNVFAGCGGIDVKFKDSIQHYIDKKIAQTQALIL